MPGAIAKAQEKLFKRFERSLEKINSSDLEQQRDILVKKLEATCFIKLRHLLELFVTLRDIHVILLSPEQGSEALEKGLHLIPTEFVNLLEPKEIATLIDAHIQRSVTNANARSNEKEFIGELGPLLESLASDHSPDEEIPPLQNPSDPRVIDILSYLQDTRCFKIGRGEKTRKIIQRLDRLGVHTVRCNGGSHRILGHPKAESTFTLPTHDELSIGVAGELEKWINRILL